MWFAPRGLRAALLLVLTVGTVSLAGTASASADAPCALGVVCAPDATPPVTTAPPPPAPAPAPTITPAVPDANPAGSLLVLLNRERAANGLPLFSRRSDVERVAQGWSAHLADAGALSHNDAYFTSASRSGLDAGALGENVARDGSVPKAHAALMNSPHHRDNILDPRFTVVGIGAVARDGSWWITEDFLQPAAARPAVAPAAASSSPVVGSTRVAVPPASRVRAGAPPSAAPTSTSVAPWDSSPRPAPA